MRIFLSYASENRDTAEEVNYALLGANHDVFFDRSTLTPGGEYHNRIKGELERCELFIFLISPHAIEHGSYTLSELGLAKQKWPRPWGFVLPVMVEPTAYSRIDKYLASVTVLEPKGSIAADVLSALAQRPKDDAGAGQERIIAAEINQIRQLLEVDINEARRRFLDFTSRFCTEECAAYALKLAQELLRLETDKAIEDPAGQIAFKGWIQSFREALERCAARARIPETYRDVLVRPAEPRRQVQSAGDLVSRFYGGGEDAKSVACRLVGVGKRYGLTGFALRDVTLDIRVGEITAVVGINASGKTTLLRMIAGDLAHDVGQLSYPALGANRLTETVKSRIAYVPQHLEPWMGGLIDNLRFAAAAAGIRGKRNSEAVEHLLYRYDLARFRDLKWHEISGGYRLRFELARALVSLPRLLILDEPLAHLDFIALQRVLDDLKTLSRLLNNPVPIVITSQHLYEIEQVATRIVVVGGGTIQHDERIADVREQASEHVYEVHFRAGHDDEFRHRLMAAIPSIVITLVLGGYVCSFAKDDVYRAAFLKACTDFATAIVLLRDLSGSTRKHFKERLIAASETGALRAYAAQR